MSPDAVRLGERLAVVDEINEDAGHELAIAMIQLGRLGASRRQAPQAALEAATRACQRSLDALRRVRRGLGGTGDLPHERELPARELARLNEVAAALGTRLELAGDLPGAAETPPGLMLTMARIIESLIRFTSGNEAALALDLRGSCMCVRVDCRLTPVAWRSAHPELERIRERLRFFDGHLKVEASELGSHAVVELPL